MAQRMGHEQARIPFDSTRKRSIVAVLHPDMTDTVRVYVKGAPEIIIPNCTTHYNISGQKVPLSDESMDYILKDTMRDAMTTKGFRTLAFSYRDFSSGEFDAIKQQTNNFRNEDSIQMLESNNTFLALVALNDPVRPRVQHVIKFAEKGNINVRMITSDNLDTAKTVAADCGILDAALIGSGSSPEIQNQYAMNASNFREIVGGLQNDVGQDGNTRYFPGNQQAFDQVIDTLKVLARANPADKLLVVAGLKAQGKMVAVVGDGLNDIPAFKTADVSFAMMSGTAMAKNSASMVLTNDDFESCLRAVMWGRNIYSNIKRFLQFQITCNFSCLVVVFIGYLYLTESPLGAVQLLWINLIMDALAALALATAPPITTVIFEPAVTGETQILQRVIWRQIYGITLWNIFVMMLMIFAGKSLFDLDYSNSEQTTDTFDGELTAGAQAKKTHLTIIFNVFVFLQFFNEINCRVVGPRELNVFKKFFSNWWFIIIMAVVFVVQWSACNWLFFLFDTYELTA